MGVSVSSVNRTSSKVRVPRIALGCNSQSANGSVDGCSDIESQSPEGLSHSAPEKQDRYISWKVGFQYSSIGSPLLNRYTEFNQQ